jgi:hypothetical protein
MMLKIVPFLVWFRVYGRRAGKEPVPTLAELSSPGTERVAAALLTAGMVALTAAAAAGESAALRAAGSVLLLGALALGASLARVLWHLRGREAGDAAAAPRWVSAARRGRP